MSIYCPQISANIGEGDLEFRFGVDVVYDQGSIIIGKPNEVKEEDEWAIGLYFETVEAFDKFLEGAKKARDAFEEYSKYTEDERRTIFEKYEQLMFDSTSRI